MADLKKKLGAGLAAFALMIGAVPGTVGAAAAWEDPHGGQHFDKKRHTTVILIAVLAAITAAFLAFNVGKDTPASP